MDTIICLTQCMLGINNPLTILPKKTTTNALKLDDKFENLPFLNSFGTLSRKLKEIEEIIYICTECLNTIKSKKKKHYNLMKNWNCTLYIPYIYMHNVEIWVPFRPLSFVKNVQNYKFYRKNAIYVIQLITINLLFEF